MAPLSLCRSSGNTWKLSRASTEREIELENVSIPVQWWVPVCALQLVGVVLVCDAIWVGGGAGVWCIHAAC